MSAGRCCIARHGHASSWRRRRRPPAPSAPHPRRYLVFTSVGERCDNIEHTWLCEEDRRDWELCVVYYGDPARKPDTLLRRADRVLCRKGGKFPNLAYLHAIEPDYLSSFEAVLVADDDIFFERADAIRELFAVRREYDLWMCQPANHAKRGKADIAELRAVDGARLRCCNFVEVTAPLFRTDKLLAFLREYEQQPPPPPPPVEVDPWIPPSRRAARAPTHHRLLVGYGIDAWFCQSLLGIDPATGEAPPSTRDKCAVVDSVRFINPTEADKGCEVRAIDRLQKFADRVDAWRHVARARGLSEHYPWRRYSHVALGAAERATMEHMRAALAARTSDVAKLL